MRPISIISKLTGVTSNVEASEITLNYASIVKLHVQRSAVASITRHQQDMVITLHSGETITIKNFYAATDHGGNQLVLEEQDGALWWVQDTATGFHFEHIANIDELLVAAGGHSDGGAIWPWVLGGLAVAAGAGIAAASGGGSDGGSDNNNGDNPNNPPGNSPDTTPPTAPTHLAISADGKTITGNAEPGSTVTIKDGNGNVIGTGTTGGDGSFTIGLNTPQISGETLTAQATDPAGNTGPSATIIAPNIALPEDPVITNVLNDIATLPRAILDHQVTNDNKPTLQGTGEVGTTVHIYDNGVEIGNVVVGANGTWSYTPGTALTEGAHVFTAIATNIKGESGEAASYLIVIDTVAPNAPVIGQLTDDVGSITGALAPNALTDDAKPALNGTGEAGATMTIFDNGVNIGSTVVASDGSWSFTPTQPLTEGSHTLTVQQTDAAGNVSPIASAPTIVVDLTPPAAPNISDISVDGTTISGTAEPGSNVSIINASNVLLGEAITDSSGHFVITLSPAQTGGEPLVAHIQDVAGNVGPNVDFTASNSGYPPVPVLISVVDDVAPATGALSEGQATNDSTPQLSGTAQANSTVTIYDNGVQIGVTTADGSGAWSYTPTLIAEGQHSFTLTATNASGTSGTSSAFTLTLDTTAPTTPSGLLVSDDGLHVTGTAEAGSTVTITDSNGNVLGTATADGSGAFDVTLTTPQTNGEVLQASATDTAGNPSPEASVTAPDTTAPAVPAIPTVTDDLAPGLGNITDNGSTNDTTPTFTGTGNAGDTITVFNGAAELGQATVQPDGNWSFTPTSPLPAAQYVISVTTTDPAGNSSAASGTLTFIIDTTAPAAPVIGTVTDNTGSITGPLTNNQSTDETQPQLSGTGEAGSIITIYDDTTPIGSATVAADGSWSFTPTLPLSEGVHNLTTVATDAAGNVSAPSAAFTLTVDTTAPTAPATPTAMDDLAPGLGNITDNGSTNDTTPTFTGTGNAGDTITVFNGVTELGQATVQPDGNWSFTPASSLPAAQYVISVTATDPAGNSSAASGALTFTIDTTAPVAPVISLAIDNTGDTQGELFNGVTTDDATPVFRGTGSAGDTITLYNGSTVLGQATVDGSGDWVLTPIAPLASGTYNLTATATDAAGNASTASNTFTLTVDTTPLTVPLVTAIIDDVAPITTPLTNGMSTNDDTLQINGTGKDGSTVTIYDNGVEIGTAQVTAGNWTFTTPTLTESAHNFTFVASDATGNTTAPTAPITITVDTTPPAAPEVLVVSADGTLVSGTAEPNSTVIIKDASDNTIGTATTSATGDYSVTLSPAQTSGGALTATAQDAAGNLSPDASFTASNSGLPQPPSIDQVVDDVAPSTGDLTNGQSTNDTLPTLSGTAQANATVTLYVDGAVFTTVTADGTGSWNYQFTAPLTEGAHTFAVSQVITGGAASGQSPLFNLTVDTAVPATPVITAVTDDVTPGTGDLVSGQATNDNLPAISGTGETGTTITLYDNGTQLATVTVDGSGNWSYTPTTALSEGSHSLTLTATDAAGNVSAPSAAFTLTVDTTAPATPAIPTASDDLAPGLGNITDNGSTNDTTPTFTGSGNAGDTITVFNGATELGQTTVQPDGNWSFTPTSPLPEAQYVISVTATDPAGNSSAASGTLTFTVDTTAPAAPVIGTVTDATGSITGPLTNNQSTDETQPQLSGTGEAGSIITIYDDTTPIGSATVAADGTWSFTLTLPLSEGVHNVTTVATDAAGNVSAPSAAFTLTVDTTAPATPAIPTASDDLAPGLGNITDNGSTNDTTPTFTGSGNAGDTITVFNGATELGQTTVQPDGNWSFTPTSPLPEAQYVISVTATDPAGNSSAASGTLTFTVDTTAPAAPVIGTVTDATGSITGPLTNNQSTDETQPQLSGTGEAGSIITIYDDTTPIGSVTVATDGTWSFTPTLPLSEGVHNLTTVATDAAGNVSAPSAAFTLTVDTTAPATPAIPTATDDLAPGLGNITDNGSTNDTTPTFTGTGNAGDTITVFNGATELGQATVQPDGSWSFTPASPLPAAQYVISVTATDPAGNSSAASGALTFTIDTTAPVAPVISLAIDNTGDTQGELFNGVTTDDATPVFRGTGSAGDTITLYNGSTVLGQATVDGSGDWVLTPIAPLASGTYNLTATATDAAGNASTASNTFTLTVDTTPLTVPLVTAIIDDVAPITTPLTNGMSTNDDTLQINGTGKDGSTVTIYDNGVEIGTAQVTAGNWTFTTPTLTESAHNFTFVASDATGNTTAPTAPITITVDTTPPAAPEVLVVSADGTLVSGTAEPNSTVIIKDASDNTIGTATASPTGDYSVTLSPAQTSAEALTATAQDAAGNLSPAVPFTASNSGLPQPPSIDQVVDDVAPSAGDLNNGQSTNDTLPTLSGTAQANATVTLYVDGAAFTTVTADGTGSWNYQFTAPLTEGAHTFAVSQVITGGATSGQSPLFSFTVDTTVPATPTITAVTDDVAPGTGVLVSGQATNDNLPAISGTGGAGTTITLYDNGTQLTTVTVDGSGNWSYTPTTALSDGSHSLTLTATDAAGNVSAPSTAFTLEIDTAAPAVPVITSVIDDVAGGVFNGSLNNGQVTNDTLPTLNGTGEAGSTIEIFDGSTQIGSATVAGDGSWTFTPTTPLSDGTHTLTISAVDAAGNTSASSQPLTIAVDTTPPDAPTGMTVNGTGTTVTGTAEAGSTVTITSDTGTVLGTATADGTGSFSVTISPAQTNGQPLLAFAQDSAGNVGISAGFTAPSTGVPGVPVIVSVIDDVVPQTDVIANGQSTNDAMPTLNGTAQANSTVSVYDNGALLGTTTVDVNGNWSYTPTTALIDGSHAFTATATNTNGTGSPSGATTVIVDTTPPDAPTALISADGATVSGVAEAGSTVTITLPSGTSVTATANSSGDYSVTLPTRQIGGELLSVNATDAAGNISSPTPLTAPTLPLSASSNVIDLALDSTAEITTQHYSDYGLLLVGALGNVVSVLGNDTAQVTFDIAAGGTGDVTIDAAATGVVLSLLNTLEIAIQKYDSETGTWSTIVDSSMPQFVNLLTLGASGVTLNIDGLEGGSYRVLSYNTSLLATGSLTSLNVSVEQTSAGIVSGETSHLGNVITDIDPVGGEDNAPTGTVVSEVTNSQGVTLPIGVGGVDIQGLYGTLHINQDGSYTYTLTDTSSAVLGHTDNFTYTITLNGVSDSAQLVMTLGNGAPDNSVTATDNTAALAYSTDVAAVDHGASSQSGFSVIGIALGNVLDVNVLTDMTNPIIFNVEDGSTRTMTLQASVGGVALLSTFDLYIYKFNDVTQQFEQYQVVNTWLTAPLLGGQSAPLTMTLPGGEYLFLLNNASGVTVLTGYTLNILQDHTYSVDSTTAITTGNVLQDDVAPVGTLVTEINGTAIASSGTTTINGQYGTLTIDAQGNYTYTLHSGLGADSINTADSFVYTVTAPNGDTDTAALNITATPQVVDAINDTSALMAVNTEQNTAAYSDTTVGSAAWNASLFNATSSNGSGTFVVDTNTILHNPVLHFNVASGLALGGLSVNWSIFDGATLVRSGTFSGSALLGGNATVDLTGLDLHAGTYTLSYTGSIGALSVGTITITPSVTGTTVDLDSYSTLSGSTIHGNIYDGSDASGAADQLASVHTLMTITGYNGSTATLDPLTNSSATTTVQGHYGTLQIGIDGAYTYTLNSGVSPAAITTKETFTYTLNDQNGHTDSATLTINMNPQFVSTAQSDVINGSVYADSLVYHLLNSANATGGNGADVWSNFSLAQGDQINVHDLLVGWDGQQSSLGNYLNVTTSGSNTVISIDRDGSGSTYNSTTLVTLENVQTTLNELEQQNHLVA